MTDTQTTNSTQPPAAAIAFGLRLQTAREALGLESKEAAAQLRLNERIILMLESDCYSLDMPATFVRGYIRSYGKLLQIPEDEIKQAIAPIKPQPSVQPTIPKTDETPKVTSSHYFMQISTYLVVFTLIGLVGAWWYNHSTTPTTTLLTQNQIQLPDEVKTAPIMPIKSEAVAGTLAMGAKITDPTTSGAIVPDAINSMQTATTPNAAGKQPAKVEIADATPTPAKKAVEETDEEDSE